MEETVRLVVRLRKDQYNKLLDAAKRDGCLTVSEYVRKVLNEKLKEV